jgi:hypothetical protein
MWTGSESVERANELDGVCDNTTCTWVNSFARGSWKKLFCAGRVFNSWARSNI